jgi:IS5 family transposase
LGVRTVAIPRQATTSAARTAIVHDRSFRKLVKWRTGCEGRISYLKRGYGWDRTPPGWPARRRDLAGTRYSPTT